ncbi:MAG: hypothetical protein ACI8W8_001971 [Rhodothermales bacterium]|jgi:hypothetical protein
MTYSRRTFLRSAFATLALPAFESIAGAATPTRMACVGNSFGMYQPQFFPKASGAKYAITPLLKPLQPHRSDFSVFSNLDHGIKGGHFATHTFLSGVRHSDAKSMPNGNITVDQRAAEVLAGETRFPSLTVGSETGLHGGCAMAWTRSGVRVPPITGPRELFRTLFVNHNPLGKSAEADQLRLRGSILDAVSDNANSLGKRLSGRDREKLDEYFSSVRDVERKLQQQQQWLRVDKPAPQGKEPQNRGLVEDIPLLYDLVALALEVDASRVVTLELAGAGFQTRFFDIQSGYHALSHHGQDPDAIRQLLTLEMYQMEQFARFIERLKSSQLLDSTVVLFGSGMGNANSHTNSNLPIILAGGGYRLGEHRVLPGAKNRRIPLCNLYLSLLQRLGIEDSSFGTSTGTFDV